MFLALSAGVKKDNSLQYLSLEVCESEFLALDHQPIPEMPRRKTY
jgi:hypothetical protein